MAWYERKVKKISREIPENGIVLGEIELSFPIKTVDTQEFRNFYLTSKNYEVLKFNYRDKNPDLQIDAITTYRTVKRKDSRGREVTNIIESRKSVTMVTVVDLSWEIINDLFRNCCTWVVENMEEIFHGGLLVKIFTKFENLPIGKAINLVEFFFDKDYSDYKNLTVDRVYPEDIFKELKEFQNNVLKYNKERDVEHEKLLPVLRPYQVRAIQWMISRERDEFQMHSSDWMSDSFAELKTIGGTELCYHLYSHILTSYALFDFPKYFRGGILADEMGLGKTVVAIGLILNNPRKIETESDNDKFLIGNLPDVKIEEKSGFSFKRAIAQGNNLPNKKVKRDVFFGGIGGESVKCLCGDRTPAPEECCVQCPRCMFYQHKTCLGYDENFVYFCSDCWESQKLIKSKATLIIAPPSIFKQWKEEIEKHVEEGAWDQGVFMYNGLKNGFVQPSVLASYDVVLTTYTVLTNEFYFTAARKKSARTEQRFLRQVPPILRIQWWRICLDEAQMIEQEQTKRSSYQLAGQMAKMIPAINHWNITGTPVQNSMNDLFHLMHWIGIKPFDDEYFWVNFLHLPFLHGNKTPLFSVLSQIFWRNSKEDVANELTIPQQTTIYHTLKFTPVESSFYMREHDAVSTEFETGLRKLHLDLDRTLDSLNGVTLARALAPMLNLRQACSHHLAVRGFEISDQLDKYNKIREKKGRVKRNMTLGALLRYLQGKTKNECVESLRSFLSSTNGLAGIFCVLKDWPAAADLYQQVLMVSEEYEKKGVKIDLLQNLHAVTNFGEILREHPEGVPTSLRDEELKKIARELEYKYLQEDMDNYEFEEKLLRKYTRKVTNLEEALDNMMGDPWTRLIGSLSNVEVMEKITDEFEGDDIESNEFLANVFGSVEGTINAWLANLRENRESVLKRMERLCDAESDDLVREGINCHLREHEKVKQKCGLCVCEVSLSKYERYLFGRPDEASEEKTVPPHKVEILLKMLLNLAKSKKNPDLRACIRDCEKGMQLLKATKEEFNQFRAVWKSLSDLIVAKDELTASKSRTDLTETQILNEKEKLTEKSKSSISKLKKKHGTLLYLKNLDKMDDSNRDPCPVCLSHLENKWCVLQCGHSYCLECITGLLEGRKTVVQCPVCREDTPGSDIGVVDLHQSENSDQKVLGDHSTKIDAIVKTLTDLKKSDPKVKVIIFSTWEVVLRVLKKALDQNCISYRRMPGSNFQKHLQEFKDPTMNVTALLLPISYGCKGLNLTEATHVFLIEPVTNPAEELQAIGRVHRMGQTKETVVHRFLVSGTIEEKIHSAVSDAKDKWNRKNVTLEDMKNLFEIDSLTEYRSKLRIQNLQDDQ